MSPNRKQYLSIFAHCDLYHFKIGDTEIISREHGGEVIDNGIGDKVQFSLDLNNACFFDFDSKKNLSL